MPDDWDFTKKKYILAGQESYFGDAKIAHWIRFDQLYDKIINYHI